MAVATGTALLGGAMAGSSVLGGIMGQKGAKAQANAANNGTNAQLAMFNQTRQDNMPWMQAGEQGLNALMTLYGMGADGSRTPEAAAAARAMLEQDPSYKFRFQQGQSALENGAAARGNFMSGNMLRALTDYGQNMASTEYSNIANRLAGLANVGQGSAQYIGNAGMNTGAQIGNNMMNAGAARASGYASMANSLNNGLTNMAMLYGMRG